MSQYIEQFFDSQPFRALQYNRAEIELDSHDIEKEYQKIKTLSPQEESRSRSPHLSPPPGSATPEEEADEEIPGGLMEQLGLVIRHDDEEATDDEYDEEEENGGAEKEESEGEEEKAVEEGFI